MEYESSTCITTSCDVYELHIIVASCNTCPPPSHAICVKHMHHHLMRCLPITYIVQHVSTSITYHLVQHVYTSLSCHLMGLVSTSTICHLMQHLSTSFICQLVQHVSTSFTHSSILCGLFLLGTLQSLRE